MFEHDLGKLGLVHHIEAHWKTDEGFLTCFAQLPIIHFDQHNLKYNGTECGDITVQREEIEILTFISPGKITS